jgi:hypothetical protein
MPYKKKSTKSSRSYLSAGLDPRYVIHFLRLLTNDEKYGTPMTIDQKYALALQKGKKAGGKKFHNKMFGGGVVFQSYNLTDLINKLNSY